MVNFKREALIIILVGLFVVVPLFGKAATTQELQAQINALLQQIQALKQELAQQQGGDAQKWCHTFNTNLRIGSSGDEVGSLRTALVREGFSNASSEGEAQVFVSFDETLASAVSGFQEKYRDEILTPNGLKYGTGYVGPSTRAKLNQLYGCGGSTVRDGWLSIQPSNVTIKIGETINVQAMYQPPMPACPVGMACAQAMPAPYPVRATWTSSNPKVATVIVYLNTCPPGSSCFSGPDYVTAGVTGVGSGATEIKATYSLPSGAVITATTNVTVRDGTTIAPQINSIYPQSGPVGMQVALTGSGFTPDMAVVCITYPCNPIGTNTVHFGPATISSVRSYDGKTLYFQVPGGYTPPCTSDGACPMNAISINGQLFFGRVSPGTYNVSVTNANGTSNSVMFTVTSQERSTIQVLSPNGGETWSKGTTQTIRWQDNTPYPVCPIGAQCAPSAPRTYDIKLSPYSLPCTGDSCPAENPYQGPYIVARNVNGYSYSWSVGNPARDIYGAGVTFPDGPYGVQICQSGTNICDSSDSYFKIVSGIIRPSSITVLSPNGGEVWKIGSTQTIKWNSENAPSVMVDLIRPGFEYHLTGPTGDVPNNGFLTFTVPSILNGVPVHEAPDYRIRVMYRINAVPVIEDQSDAPFGIIAGTSQRSITVISPNGGEQIPIGPNNFQIKYSISGFNQLKQPGIQFNIYQNGTFLGSRCSRSEQTGSIPCAVSNDSSYWNFSWDVGSYFDATGYHKVSSGSGFQIETILYDGTQVVSRDSSDASFSIVNPVVNAIPVLSSLSPYSGQVGTMVILKGSGFTAKDNAVIFGGGYIKNLSSLDGTTISFVVPEGLDLCGPGAEVCAAGYPKVIEASYRVGVVNGNGTSNFLSFTVTPRSVY